MQKKTHNVHQVEVRRSQHFHAPWLVKTMVVVFLAVLLGACESTITTGTGTPAATGGHTPTPAATSTRNSTGTPPPGSVPGQQLQFTTLRMINTSTGWGLTTSTVYKTTDGGKYWNNAGPLSTQLKNPSGVFLNAQDAWIVTTVPNSANPNAIQVIRTQDGGHNWQSAQSSILSTNPQDYAGAIDFVNAQDGWIELVTNGGPAAGSESVDIFRTTDGGLSWSRVASTSQQSSGLPNGGLKSGISFKDTMNGWATGNDASNTPWLYVTHNGGQTWQRQSLPGVNSNEFYLTTPPVFLGNLGILPVAVSFQGGKGSEIYTTTNGGQAWTAPQALVPFYASNTNDLYVLDTQRAWAIGAGGQLYTTTNTPHWQEWQVLPGNAAQFNIIQLSFVNASDGWGVCLLRGTRSLVYTTDGGHTWAPE